ncbi:MAG: hypothetical protein PHO67_01115 [Candidatus Omnitrophica bacterium]|nr:hypothetical protein [Candidatus Omnitrophota bacterium]
MKKIILITLILLFSFTGPLIPAKEENLADSTPPSAPVINTDKRTKSLDMIVAHWKSEDPESGIAEYQYAIGTVPEGTDVLYWTSNGPNEDCYVYQVRLEKNKNYYISVVAKNKAGLKSKVATAGPIKAAKEVYISVEWPRFNSIIRNNETRISGTAEGVDTVNINGREFAVNDDESFKGPTLVAPGYAARKGIDAKDPNYIIMNFPGKTDIKVSAEGEESFTTCYYYQAYLKSSTTSESYAYSDEFQSWNMDALAKSPFADWKDYQYPSRIRTKKNMSEAWTPWQYCDYYFKWWRYYHSAISYPGKPGRCTSSMTIHTLPAKKGEIEPMILLFQECMISPYDFKGRRPDISEYKMNGRQLKWFYGDANKLPNCAYIILDKYVPDTDIELKVEAPVLKTDTKGNPTELQTFACRFIDVFEMELVRETPFNSGNYSVVQTIPIFTPDTGEGRGLPLGVINMPFLKLNLDKELSDSQVDHLNAELRIADKVTKYTLTETSPNSQVFTDESKDFVIKFEPLVKTSPSEQDDIVCFLTSKKNNINDQVFNLRETASDSLCFEDVKVFITVWFKGELSDQQKDMMTIQFTKGMMAGDQELTETGENSLEFTNKDGDLTVRLNNYKGKFSGALDVTAPNKGYMDLKSPRLILERVDPSKYCFTNENFGNGTNVTQEDPGISGEGIFRARIRGLHDLNKYSLNRLVIVITVDGVSKSLKLTKHTDGSYITGNLLLVLKDQKGERDYKGVTVFHTDGKKGVGAISTKFMEVNE